MTSKGDLEHQRKDEPGLQREARGVRGGSGGIGEAQGSEATRASDGPPDPPVRLVQDEGALGDLLADLESVSRAGVDIEANSFHAYFERVCLIQVSTATTDWVVDPLAVDPRPMGGFLADESREVVLHAGEFDVVSLKRDFGFQLRGVFDTQVAAMLLGMGQVGYSTLVERFFGVELRKGQQRSDWGRRPLSSRQVAYAAADTRYLLPLRDRLANLLEEKRRTDEARAGFARLEASEPRARLFDPEGYRRLKGFRELDPSGRAIARALYLVREKQARSLDRPPFRVLGNETLIRMAMERPRDEASLSTVKGVPEATRRRFAKALLAAIQEGLEDPRPPSARGAVGRGRGRRGEDRLDSAAAARFERLRLWRNSRAEEMGIEGRLIAKNEELKRIAKGSPRSLGDLGALFGADSYMVGTYGEEILAVLEGRLSNEAARDAGPGRKER